MSLLHDALQLLLYEAELFLKRNQLRVLLKSWGFKLVQRSLRFTLLIGFSAVFGRAGLCLVVSLGEGRFGMVCFPLLAALLFRQGFVEETEGGVGKWFGILFYFERLIEDGLLVIHEKDCVVDFSDLFDDFEEHSFGIILVVYLIMNEDISHALGNEFKRLHKVFVLIKFIRVVLQFDL